MAALFSFLFLLCSLLSHAQFEYFGLRPELKRQLEQARQDTTRLRLYVRLSNNYVFSYPDTALQYAQQGLRLAQRINNQRWAAYNSLSIAQSFIVMGNQPTAIEIALKTLSTFEKMKDTVGIIFGNLILSWAHREVGDLKKGVFYALNAKRYSEATNHSSALQIALEHLTGEYEQLNELDSALYYGKQMLGNERAAQPEWVGYYRTLANVYFKKEQYDHALHYYRRTIAPSIQFGVLPDLIDAYVGMAQVFQKIGHTDSSIFYANSVLRKFPSVPKLDGRYRAAIILAENYQQDKNSDSTLKYTRLSIAYKDSLSTQEKMKAIQNIFYSEQFRQQEIQQQQKAYKNRIRTYLLIGGLVVLLCIAGLLYRNNVQKQRANTLLQQEKEKTERALQDLKATQAQLVQSEKMASLGELTAGIAHEIQNPLNFVNNFSEANVELLDELKQEIKKGNMEDADAIATDAIENQQKIVHHGRRAEAIVKNMLQHSRTSKGERQLTDINVFVNEYLHLAYHGYRAKDKSFTAKIETHFDESIGKLNIVPQEIGRVLLNLFNNAFYAVHEKMKKLGDGYEPTICVTTHKWKDKIEVRVRDNGMGISKSFQDKIFQPFFTTKPAGQGTGLGLSLSYDIVKAHGGELLVESDEGNETAFSITLPLNKP
jgi:signal transduction histidine kinase